ncbi:MAG: carboxypeptidase regulatory-like domain-containing protein [Deltaproteobacteria bacterium]|nr:carboxypeptidase regulatory-like domain-containing protein [Deltaproteobacteria bacterium]
MPNSKKLLFSLIVAIHGLFVPARSFSQQGEAKRAVGVTASALPGMNRVGVPVSDAPSLMVAGSAGYGFTESIGSAEGSHHRLRGILSGGVSIWPWLSLGLSLDGRYDIHPDDEEGSDQSIVGDPRLLARGGYRLSDNFQIGAQLGLLFPGSDAPSIEFGATTLDALLLCAYTPTDIGLTVAALAGFRLDNSAQSAPPLDQMRPGDRLSLGISDYNAVLIGLGGSYWISPVEIIAEVTWDILVGESSPGALTSPLRVAAGGRVEVLPALSLELLTETLVSERPDDDSFENVMMPIEPRFSALAGLRFLLDLSGPRPVERKRPVRPPETKREEPQFASVVGTLVDESGEPVAAAQVTLQSGEKTIETESDEQGAFRFDEVPMGEAQLRAKAEGFEDSEWNVRVVSDMPAQQPRQLRKSSLQQSETPAAQLRGLIRSFDGKPLSATITIAPLGMKLTTDANGRFETDVPPGAYLVTIRSNGYQTQRRKVTVDKNGVSIINADLRRKR